MNHHASPSRRRIMVTGACAGLLLSSRDALAQDLVPTPACHDGDEPTLPETEGPFFKPKSPQRSDLREAGIRIEPPPSLACASGRIRAATLAAAPPDEPPDECARFQGF